MGLTANWKELEQRHCGGDARQGGGPWRLHSWRGARRREKFEGTQPSGCSFWRLAAEGRTFYTVPENHFNCAVGAYTHNIALSPDRKKKLTTR